MKKRGFKSILSFLMVLITTLTFSVTTYAAKSGVTFNDGKITVFQPGSVYTDSDLFDNLKGIMPGDVRTETVTIENNTDDYDYINVYMRAVPHDESGNPISENVLAQLRADNRMQPNTELEYMYDFLSQLSLKVWNGSTIIYNESADKLGGLSENVYLGSIRKNETLNLNVELNIPIEMGNEHSNRIGEVDWLFVIEGFDDPKPPENNYTNLTARKVWVDDGVGRPDSVKVTLYNGNTAVESVLLGDWNKWSHTWYNLDSNGNWKIIETNIPDGYTPSYSYKNGVVIVTNTETLIQTGQLNWPIPVLGGLGILLVAYGFIIMRKKRNNEQD